jgi:hypothetical protein
MVGELQRFIDKLPKEKKYYTIVQYDDGILNDISGLDIIVYSMGCKKPGYYPIPLLSEKENTATSRDPLLFPDGICAKNFFPPLPIISISIVGSPRESNICRTSIFSITLFIKLFGNIFWRKCGVYKSFYILKCGV